MTLDEAIYREEALAYSFRERYKRLGEPVGDLPILEQEHKQMAEWLRELKEYRKVYTCRNCYNSSASFNDYPCCECRRCFKVLDGIKDHYEEVNADEDSD